MKDHKAFENQREAGKMYAAVVSFCNNIVLADKAKTLNLNLSP